MRAANAAAVVAVGLVASASSVAAQSEDGGTPASTTSGAPTQRLWCAHGINPASLAPPLPLASLWKGPQLLWSDALFQVPKALVENVDRGGVAEDALTLDPYGLAHLLCGLELPHVAPLDYFGLCHRTTHALEKRSAACGKDGVCVLRAPLYRQPCINLTVFEEKDAKEWGRNIEVFGADPWVRFGQIRKDPIEASDAMRPWERFFSWKVDPVDDYHAQSIQSLPRYPTYLFLGALLLAAAEPLSENRAFHMVVSATMGMAVSSVLALVILLWFFNNIRYEQLEPPSPAPADPPPLIRPRSSSQGCVPAEFAGGVDREYCVDCPAGCAPILLQIWRDVRCLSGGAHEVLEQGPGTVLGLCRVGRKGKDLRMAPARALGCGVLCVDRLGSPCRNLTSLGAGILRRWSACWIRRGAVARLVQVHARRDFGRRKRPQ